MAAVYRVVPTLPRTLMAAINAKRLRNLIKTLQEQLGHDPTVDELRRAMDGRK